MKLCVQGHGKRGMTTEEELPDIDAHDVGKKAEEEKIFKPEDVVAVRNSARQQY